MKLFQNIINTFNTQQTLFHKVNEIKILISCLLNDKINILILNIDNYFHDSQVHLASVSPNTHSLEKCISTSMLNTYFLKYETLEDNKEKKGSLKGC